MSQYSNNFSASKIIFPSCRSVIKYFEDAFDANTRELDGNSMSPLHIACAMGQRELFHYLMLKGVSIGSVTMHIYCIQFEM